MLLHLEESCARVDFWDCVQGTKGWDEVAIKQIKIDIISEDVRTEFEGEVRAVARLRSKNIVQFYDYCLSPKYIIVMKYMPRGSLTNLY